MLKIVESVQTILDPDEAFQTSTIAGLLEGRFQGSLTLEELARHGDFGLGTFDSLQGEMVACDGEFYQVRDGGVARLVSPDQTTPFAMVKFFRTDKTRELKGDLDLNAIHEAVDALTPVESGCVAVRVSGLFHKVEARAIQPVSEPFPPLAEATQSEFSKESVKGSLIGFRFPADAAGLNVPGYHLHFLSDDRTFGGHAFAVTASEVLIEIDTASQLHLALPPGVENPEELSEELKGTLHAIETAPRGR